MPFPPTGCLSFICVGNRAKYFFFLLVFELEVIRSLLFIAWFVKIVIASRVWRLGPECGREDVKNGAGPRHGRMLPSARERSSWSCWQ